MSNLTIKLEEENHLKEEKTIVPDNYFTYDIHRHLRTDFHTIEPKNKENIYVCCFRIVQSQPIKIIKHPFLEYLLYQYPSKEHSLSNLCIFPFSEYTNGKVLNIGKTLVKKIFNTVYKSIGYIRNKDGIFLFYNIDFDKYQIKQIKRSNELWWALIDEICNNKVLFNFPIHDSVTHLFISNPKLIYLKDKNKHTIESPTVAYLGGTQETLPYISIMGTRVKRTSPFGPYYYFTDYNGSIRDGGWDEYAHNKKKKFGKVITDSNGKFLQGGIIRFALFLGNSRVILYRNSSFNKYPKANDTHTFSEEQKIKEKWAKDYESLVVGRIKFKNLSGYLNYNTQFIVKNFIQFTSLSNHLIDMKSLKSNWDPTYQFYSIK